MPLNHRNNTLFIAATVLVLVGFDVSAGPFERDKLPPELKGWADWVLFDVPAHACPYIQDEAVCFWPGRLTLALDSHGGRFTQEVVTDVEGLFPLPGEAAHWPETVTLDGRPAVVVEREGVPVVALGPGRYKISGTLVWDELPEGIAIPAGTAMIALTVNDQPIPFPRRDEGGRLWLVGSSAEDEGEELSLSVMRRIRDAIPLIIETRIVIRASGKAREVSLGQVLIEDTVPLSVTAEIPSRLDQEGTLDLQVRAGTHVVTIKARTKGSPEGLRAATKAPPWPADEIWAWQADERLRQVTLSGAPGIDPSRTDLPEDWHGLPAYLMTGDTQLDLSTTRRGEIEPPPDAISLDRTLWMDLDGAGYTIKDALSGTLNRSWRLDLSPPAALGHVSSNGDDQLITKGASGRAGVELRNGKLDMIAESRLEAGARELPAVGWSTSVQHLAATLNLPPGWTLVTARGVDDVSGTWWDQWDLFGFFFVLIISIAIGRLTRWPFGVVAFFALTLSHHEDGAPVAVWVSLLITLGLLKVLPLGKLRVASSILWWLSVVWLAAVLVPFSVQQMRSGLFPQVLAEKISRSLESAAPDARPGPGKRGEPTPPEPAYAKRAYGLLSSSSGGDISQKADGDAWKQQEALRQDPKAVVQTGFGVPSWHWNSWRLEWSGPVTADHRIRLYLLSPRVNLALSVLRVLLLVLIALRVVAEGVRIRQRVVGGPGAAGAAAAGAVTLLLSLSLSGAARAERPPIETADTDYEEIPGAELPSAPLLRTLKERLTAKAPCRPSCVSISFLKIDISDKGLVLEAEVHAEAPSGAVLPGPAKNWIPDEVSVDGRPESAVVLRDDGFLYLRMERGVHRVMSRGPAPRGGALTLAFGRLPKRVLASADGWTVDGIHPDGRAESSVQLTRKAERETGMEEGRFEEGAYPPWLEVTRTLDLGIPWLMRTTVRRVSPLGTPVLATVPLLAGESVTESELQVENGAVIVALGRNDASVSWSSTLKTRARIEIAAPRGVPWSEIWEVQCSPVWACAFDGLAPIQRKSGNLFKPVYRPWPGERLIIGVNRPKGIEGQSTTVDSAELTLSPGKRLVSATLALSVRSSRGGEQGISLPGGAEIQTLLVDGAKQPYRQQGNTVTLTLRPGTQHISLPWQQTGGIRALYRAPEISLGGPAANVSVKVELPRDRWLLLVGGPSWGPAVLFWGFLLTVLIAGLILGRIRLSPLKSWQWMLLSLGLTQVPVPVALIIVGWFLAFAWRKAHPPRNNVMYDTLQIVLGIYTLVALGCLVAAVYNGLAVQPDMQVKGADSTNTALRWYLDHTEGALPTPWVLSLPIVVWKIVMLLWALWLAGSTVKWAPWAWRAFSHEGLWHSRPKPGKNSA